MDLAQKSGSVCVCAQNFIKMSESHKNSDFLMLIMSPYFRVYGSTLCRIDAYSSDANTKKSTGMDTPFKHVFPFLRDVSDNTKAAMKKEIWRIHSTFSHV